MTESDKLLVENGVGGINGIRSEEAAERKKVFVCNSVSVLLIKGRHSSYSAGGRPRSQPVVPL